MSFLKTLGLILAKGFQLWTGLAPILQAELPNGGPVVQTVSRDLAAIGNIVIQVEAIGAALGLSGTQKLTAAAAAIKPIVLDSALIAGKAIADPGGFNRSVDQLISGVVGVLNSVHPDAAAQHTTAATIQPVA